LFRDEMTMALKAKYISFYVGGMLLWTSLLYIVGHRWLCWRLSVVATIDLILAVVLGVGQVAMYRSETISCYRSRVRRRMQVAACIMLALWSGICIWLPNSNSISWRLALFCWLSGLVVGAVSLWAGYKSVLKWRLGSRPDDKFV